MQHFWSSLGWILPELELTRAIILESLEQTRIPHEEFQAAARALFDPPGKMIRPALLILSARVFSKAGNRGIGGGVHRAEDFRREFRRRYPQISSIQGSDLDLPPFESALPLRIYLLAAAIEVLHNAILLHDDVLDDANFRRGLPTARKGLGNRISILLGDHLLTMAFQMVSEAASLSSGRLISRVTAGICRGELLQNALLFNTNAGMSRRLYKQRIAGKTALLFSLSAEIGSREMRRNDQEGKHGTMYEGCMRRYGYALGMAFQIIDDVFDIQHHHRDKPAGQDLKQGIVTLPVIYMLENGDLSPQQLQSMWEKGAPLNAATEALGAACACAVSQAEVYGGQAETILQKAMAEDTDRDPDPLRKLTKILLSRRL